MGSTLSFCIGLPDKVTTILEEGITTRGISDGMIPQICEWIDDLEGKVRSINFKSNKITSSGAVTLFQSLESNNYVEKIRLGYNRIDDQCMLELGILLFRNKRIFDVSLDGNLISDLGIDTLTTYIMKGTGITSLRLNDNKGITDASTTNLFKLLKHTNLQKLNLEETSMKERHLFMGFFTESIKNGSLNCIENSNSNWMDDTLERFCDLLAYFRCNKLIHVKSSLSRNPVTSKGAKSLLKTLESHPSLRSLSLSHTYVNDDFIAELVDMINILPSLQTIHLENTLITDEGIRIIERHINKDSNLKSLYISDNMYITQRSSIPLVSMILKSKIECIEFSGFSSVVRNAIMHSLAKNTLEGGDREQLFFNQSNVTDEDIDRMSKLIAKQRNNNIKNIGFIENNITSKGASMLFDSIKWCRKLQTVILSRNEINDECLHSLLELIFYHSELEYVNLSWNQISDTGVKTLAENGFGMPLKKLDLSFNSRITAESICHLKVLAEHTYLERINLLGTQINEQEREHLNSLLSIPITHREIPIPSNSKSAAKISR